MAVATLRAVVTASAPNLPRVRNRDGLRGLCALLKRDGVLRILKKGRRNQPVRCDARVCFRSHHLKTLHPLRISHAVFPKRVLVQSPAMTPGSSCSGSSHRIPTPNGTCWFLLTRCRRRWTSCGLWMPASKFCDSPSAARTAGPRRSSIRSFREIRSSGISCLLPLLRSGWWTGNFTALHAISHGPLRRRCRRAGLWHDDNAEVVRFQAFSVGGAGAVLGSGTISLVPSFLSRRRRS